MFKEDLKQAGVNWKKAKAHAANYNQWNMLVPCGKDGSKEDDDTICNIYTMNMWLYCSNIKFEKSLEMTAP